MKSINLPVEMDEMIVYESQQTYNFVGRSLSFGNYFMNVELANLW